MSRFRIYIYGDIDNYQKTFAFLSNDDENIKHIKSISEFIKDSKTHDTYDKSAILNAGYAVDSGFYEYYNIFPIKENEIVFCSIKIANNIPQNGIFKNSTLIKKEINPNFIMSNSHLLCELLQDGWGEFNKNIEELNINIYMDDKYPIYEINNNIYEQFKIECSIYNQMMTTADEIKLMQKNGVSEATIAAYKHSQQRLEQMPEKPVENTPALEQNNIAESSSIARGVNSYFTQSANEQRIKERINKYAKSNGLNAKNPDYVQYYNKKYGGN